MGAGGGTATNPVVIGAVAGLAWAAGFRGFMAEVAGAESTVEWTGTFVGILLPGLVTGALLGWAEWLRRTGGRRGWRWLALAPLAFVVATPTVVVSVVTDGGLGGGAIAIPLFGMAGGYALSGRGPVWARTLAGAVLVLGIVGWASASTLVGGDRLALTTPRGAWVTVLYASSLVVLALGCSIPHRACPPAVARKAGAAGSPVTATA